MKSLDRTVAAALSTLLVTSVVGGPHALRYVGLGFLGRWGAILLWLGYLIARRFEKTSLVSPFGKGRWEWVLALVLLVGLALRWPLAGLDVEHYIGPDEGEMVENTLEMMRTGYLHHRHPGYPGLIFYLQMVPATAHLLAARAEGQGSSIRELPREGFYRSIRRMTLLAGWLASLVVYLAGRRWLGSGPAVLAASLVALAPLGLRESGVVSPDLMLTFFVAVGLGLSLRVVDEPDVRNFAWAGVWIGLAAAIKYTGALLAVTLVVACLSSCERRLMFSRVMVGAVMSVAAFVVTSPYTLLDLPNTLRGLTMHAGYYQAAEMNAPGSLSRVLVLSGLGLPAAGLAFVGAIGVLTRLEKQGLVVLSFPFAYFLLFSYFQRTYARHALVLLPAVALVAARAARWCFEPQRRSRWLSWAAFAVLLAPPFISSVALGVAARRTTPAARASLWIEENIPPGSRILEDQFTPHVDPSRYRTHRLQVEEEVFAGDYDYVLHSGYPPGLPTDGLRPVARFEPQGSLGAAITVYQVPDRESLMGVTLSRTDSRAVLPAGALPFFGSGWSAPSGTAFGTSRLSKGSFSELFFVLEGDDPQAIRAELRGASLLPNGADLGVRAELNGQTVARLAIVGDEPNGVEFTLPGNVLREGMNRLALHYDRTVRLNRRHPDAALSFFGLTLERLSSNQPSEGPSSGGGGEMSSAVPSRDPLKRPTTTRAGRSRAPLNM